MIILKVVRIFLKGVRIFLKTPKSHIVRIFVPPRVIWGHSRSFEVNQGHILSSAVAAQTVTVVGNVVLVVVVVNFILLILHDLLK